MSLRRPNHAIHDDDADRESCRVPPLTVVLLVALALALLVLLQTTHAIAATSAADQVIR